MGPAKKQKVSSGSDTMPPEIDIDFNESQSSSPFQTKKCIQETIHENIMKLETDSKKKDLPKIAERKDKNAKSRGRAAKAREKIAELKGKDDGEKKVEKKAEMKEKRKAYSKAWYTKEREKIAEAKGKDDDEKKDEEIRLLQILEDRQRKWKEKRIEKKQEIERILAIPESERTKKDLLILRVAMKEKQKQSERNI